MDAACVRRDTRPGVDRGENEHSAMAIWCWSGRLPRDEHRQRGRTRYDAGGCAHRPIRDRGGSSGVPPDLLFPAQARCWKCQPRPTRARNQTAYELGPPANVTHQVLKEGPPRCCCDGRSRWWLDRRLEPSWSPRWLARPEHQRRAPGGVPASALSGELDPVFLVPATLADDLPLS